MHTYDKVAVMLNNITRKRTAHGVVRRKEEGGRMELGKATLRNGTLGEITDLYNKGQFGRFKATNGPYFTISESDLDSKHDLGLQTVFDILRELQAIGNGAEV